MVHDEQAKDVRFFKAGPNSLGMRVEGNHYAGQEIPEGATAPSEAGEPDDSVNAFQEMFERIMEGNFEGARDALLSNLPKPCPAAYAIIIFVHSEVMEHIANIGVAAIEAGDIGEGLQAQAVVSYLNRSLNNALEAGKGMGLSELPELTFDKLHELLSATYPEMVCEFQAAVNAEMGFDSDEASATIQEILSRQPGKSDRSAAVSEDVKAKIRSLRNRVRGRK